MMRQTEFADDVWHQRRAYFDFQKLFCKRRMKSWGVEAMEGNHSNLYQKKVMVMLAELFLVEVMVK